MVLFDYNSNFSICVCNYGLLLMWHDHLFTILIPSRINILSTVKNLRSSDTNKLFGGKNATPIEIIFEKQCKCAKSDTTFLGGPRILNGKENTLDIQMEVNLMSLIQERDKKVVIDISWKSWKYAHFLNKFRKQVFKTN